MQRKFNNNHKVYLAITPDDIEQKLYCEPKVFEEEQYMYQENILQLLMDIIGKELTRLTQLQREIILRNYYKEQSFHIIAADLEVSPQAVHQAHNRAMATLKRRLHANPYFIKLHNEYVLNDPPVDILVKFSTFLGK